MVMEVVHEDMAEGNMQCINHPYKTSIPGGICAFCLQEKLGKLVSSSSPMAVFPSSSSSSSPSFRSDFGVTASASAGAVQVIHNASSSANNETGGSNCSNYRSRRSRFPFVSTGLKKKNKDGSIPESTSIVFKRSKSMATPRRGTRFLDENFAEHYNPQRRGFWSFLYMTKYSSPKKTQKQLKDSSSAPATTRTVTSSSVGGATEAGEKKNGDTNVVVENASPDEVAIDRKVSRSRSVGCGSRSFSGDFFERISTGFGDCTLRRVESQREGKPKRHSDCRNEGNNCGNGQDYIKERVICGGIFSGFIVTSSSSSSSSSYWVSSSAEDNNNANGKHNSAVHPRARQLSHGRSRSWGWALASPLRAFAKPSSGKRDSIPNKNNVSPNLAAIPSILTLSG